MSPERAAEYIAMLTAHIAKIEPAITAFNTLRATDVAMANAMINCVPARLLNRVKYCEDLERSDDLESAVLGAIERGALTLVVDKIAAPQRWKIPRPGFIRDMCRLALYETISPPLCPTCRGRSFILPSKKLGRKQDGARRDCDRCKATGKGSLRSWQRSELLRVEQDAWARSWKDRYSAILKLFSHYEGVGLGGLAKRLG